MIYYAAIDLHCNQSTVVLIDEKDRQVFKRRYPNDLELILYELSRFADQLEGIAIESTFNWYWLVDGLQEAGYRVHLVHTAAVRKYEGLKEQNDWTDAFWLAHLLRLGLLPTGYIYPRSSRGLRDLFRKRLRLVSQRTAHILSLESLYNRCRGGMISASQVRHFSPDILADEDWSLMAAASQQLLACLDQEIGKLERRAARVLSDDRTYGLLQTMGGVGKILAATIGLETGDVSRFQRVGQYASYCRCVQSQKISNQKKKGAGNRKNGNSYLALAWREAAQGALVWQPEARRFYQRKRARKNIWVARNALAHKLCRAGYFIMRDQVEYNPALLFG